MMQSSTVTESSFSLGFEKYVREFLSQLKFHDVDGGPTFKLGGWQLDAVARHEDTLLVIECVTAKGRKRIDFRNEITNLKGKMQAINHGLKDDGRYKDCVDVKFILASNASPSQNEMDLADAEPKVYLWSRGMIDYYLDLKKKIGEIAKNGLLAELDIKPRLPEIIRVPCLKADLNGTTLYSFFVEPKKLLQNAFVARRENTNESYYQRMIKTERLNKIAYYLKHDNGFFPNNIIIAFSPDQPPEYVSVKESREGLQAWPSWLDFGVLTFPQSYRSCWVVDGQHRLYSFTHLEQTDLKVPVTALVGLPLEDQANLFLIINSKQKPVPPDLVWDLQGQLRPSSVEGNISNLVKKLNEEGPLQGLIYVPSKGLKSKGQLRMSGLCNTIKRRRLLKGQTENMKAKQLNPLYDKNPETMIGRAAKALNEYFTYILNEAKEPLKSEFVLENSGANIYLSLYERLLAALNAIPGKTDFEKLIRPLISELNGTYVERSQIHSLKLRCNSEGGRSEVTDDFAALINEKANVQLPLSGLMTAGLRERCISFESDLRKAIDQTLSKMDRNWIRTRTPSDVYARVSQKRESSTGSLVENLTLGECIPIIERNDNWEEFKQYFLDSRLGFTNKEMVMVALKEVKHVRDCVAHGKPLSWKYGDRQVIDLYLDKFKKITEKWLMDTSPARQGV